MALVPGPRGARFLVAACTLSVFLMPALSLALPSGYSFGAALLLLVSLAALPRWIGRPLPDVRWRWVIASFLLMAASWQMDSLISQNGWRGADKPVKYLLMVPCIYFVARFPPREAALWAGTALGAIGAGLLALVQKSTGWMLEAGRAGGWTNAIQFGNLSLLLGLICAIGLLVPTRARSSLHWRLLLGAGVALGLCGSLLSQSRGGWLGLLLALPVLAFAARTCIPRRRIALTAAVVLLPLALAAALPGSPVRERIDTATHEVQAYETRGDSETSLGQRLEHWKLAWRLGLEKPVFGWTQRGYTEEKQRLADAGQIAPSVLQFNHAHNEYLDVFAKRGTVGVLLLLLLYAVPVAFFWPRRKARDDRRGLRLAGLAIPVCYAGFGLTQAFIGHNSGTLFFVFMTTAFYACLWAPVPVESGRAAAARLRARV
jgi:O-antigen ligase